MIKLYNTLSGEKEPLPVPSEQKKIRLFVCGPTVYDYLHIGNARTYIFFDFFVKYLRSQGYDVNYLQNITDIDDKIIKRASEEGKLPDAVAEFFTNAYFEDMAGLGVTAVTEYAPATKFITQIVAQVERLIDKGFAYKIDDDGWYFDIAKDEDYGKLSHRTVEQAEDGTSRIDEAIGKRNKGDFCLWKFSKPSEPSWPGLHLGAGRPGWHIEDTAISEFYFGPQYEIHGGGVDLKFPHHEAEIAQQESASGLKPFVQTWMHVGALLVEGKKMSKSVGNFVTIRDFLEKYSPEVLRWIVFDHDYKAPIDYSDKMAEEAMRAMDIVNEFFAKLEIAIKENGEVLFKDLPATIDSDRKNLFDYLANDLNIRMALASFFATIGKYQDFIWKLGKSDAKILKNYIEEIFDLFSFSLTPPQISPKAQQLAAERELCRGSKQFEQSDALRREINDLGYDIEDTPKGPFLWPRPNHKN